MQFIFPNIARWFDRATSLIRKGGANPRLPVNCYVCSNLVSISNVSQAFTLSIVYVVPQTLN